MSLLFAELTATCNALGYAVAGKTKYLLDDECKEAVRELIRFLRRDDETHEIRRYLGSAKILEKDLVPILIHRRSNEEILDLLLRLLVNLTTPTLLLYNEEIPTERTSRQYYQSIVKSLQTYKQAFADKNLWTVLSEKLTNLLALEWSDRGEEKSLIIVRILILVRNILHIPVDTDTERRPDNDASIHDQILWALHEGGMINLILYIAASENEQQYYFHVLEIISLMLRDQNAETLASSSVQRSDEEKQRDLQELMAVRAKEVEDRQKKIKKHIAARHSRFGGTFVVKGVKSISDNDLVVHSLNNQITSSFDTKKHKLKTPKNRAPMQCDVVERRSAFSVRVLMKEFCIEFLNGAYNGLMRYIREMFARGKAQSNDESYYFWTMRFFMQFNRFYKFEVKLISETMSIQIFHFIQERLEDWRANLIIDKKKVHLWSKRMHLALKAYQELLNTLMKMYNSQDKSVRDSSHTIMSNIFYIVEYRELLMSLLNLFDEIKFSKEYLKDLIESNHVFMKMLEHYCKRHRALVVQNKPKTVRRKKKAKKSAKQTRDLTAECTEEKWNEMESKISDIVEQRGDELTVQSSPFDAASDVPFEEQKVEAMRRIRLLLVKGDTEEAIGLFRACREVWPENDCFGSANMSSAEERAALKEIFFTDIGFPTGDEIEVKNCTSADKFLCKDGLRCLRIDYTCDGFCNCFDCSDENENCLKNDYDLMMKCPHAYFETVNGPECFCDPNKTGYTKLCRDIKPCSENYAQHFSEDSFHLCHQRCIRFRSKRQCSCFDGYHPMNGTLGAECLTKRATVVNEPSEDESEYESDNEEAMAMNIQVNEQSFQFEDFIKKFAKQKIVYACCLLLGQFEKNTSFTNHCVLKLLHRIAFDCKYSAILFQASVFRTFQQILDSTEEQHKELKKFATFIIRKFVEVAKKNDKVYMELLFLKGHKEAYEIEEGYGSLASANSGKVSWSEEQEDELRRLFAEYENEKPEQDMVDWIHRNIIDQSRSRKSLMKKLREMYLIVGPQKRKSSSSRPPREFSEAEVAQITQLFNEFREAYDVVGCIMERLDVQRPKKRIVDKILELGLIEDRRELRKKKGTSNMSDRIIEDSGDSSVSSSDDDDDDERTNRNVPKEVKNPTHCLVSSQVASTMKIVLNSGMKEALEWIELSLNEVLEELGGDEDDVPILPLADYSVKAMDNDDFQNFLKSVGIKPPADSQETYWRIPGSWQANDIRKRVTLMRMVLDGKEIEEDETNVNGESQIDSDFEDNIRLENGHTASSRIHNDSIDLTNDLDNSHASPRETPASQPVSLTSNEHVSTKKRKRFNVEEFRNIAKQQKTKKKKIRRIVNDDDEDENNLDASVTEGTSSGSKSKVKKNKIQRITNDDDDSDDLLSRPHHSSDETSSDDEINFSSLQKAKKKSKQMAANDVAKANDQTNDNVSDVPSNVQVVNDVDEDSDIAEIVDIDKSSNIESKVDSQPKTKKKRIRRIVVNDDESDDDLRNDDIINDVPLNVEMNGGSSAKEISLRSDDESDTENVPAKKKKKVDLADSEDSDAELLSNPLTKSYGLDSDSE